MGDSTRAPSATRAKQEAEMRTKGYVTVSFAAATFKVPAPTIYSWLRARKIPVDQTAWVGNKLFIAEIAMRALAGPLSA